MHVVQKSDTQSVATLWDSDAQVYFAASDDIKIHIEAATLDELDYLVRAYRNRITGV